MSGIQTFGENASKFAAGLPAGVNAIIADPDQAVFALQAATQRRLEGDAFYASALFHDRLAFLAQEAGTAALTSAAPQHRRATMTAFAQQRITLNGVQMTEANPFAGPMITTVHDFVLCAHALLVRSHLEAVRLVSLVGRAKRLVARSPGVDRSVPNFERAKPATLVIWAPHLRAEQVGVLAFGLSEMLAPVIIVAKGGTMPGLRVSVVGLDRAQEVLSTAAAVVDASISDPSSAIALAEYGVPLAAASTSGAHEYLDGVNLYDPWNWQSVAAAVSKARSGVIPRIRERGMSPDELQTILSQAVPEVPKSAPLVSILIPTYNRRDRLEHQLERLQAQTYPEIEIVVSNDGGESVADIVEKFPNAKLHNCAQNGGSSRATNAAFEASSGAYVCVIPDDDVFYPDHIARMVQASLASGRAVLHANIIFRLLEQRAGGYRTFGFRSHYHGHLDPSETLGVVNVSVQGMFFKRSVFEDEPFYDDDIPLTADSEMVMRLSRRNDFLHVDFVGGEAHYRSDQSQQSQKNGAQLLNEMKIVFERYPIEGRPDLVAIRERSLAALTSMLSGGGLEPAIRIPEEVEA